jgi:hypothetical protein
VRNDVVVVKASAECGAAGNLNIPDTEIGISGFVDSACAERASRQSKNLNASTTAELIAASRKKTSQENLSQPGLDDPWFAGRAGPDNQGWESSSQLSKTSSGTGSPDGIIVQF